MRRGDFKGAKIKTNEGGAGAGGEIILKPEDQVKVRRNTVEDVLDLWKKDPKKPCAQAVKLIKDGENGEKKGVQQSLEQLAEILCSVGHFGKALELLESGLKEQKDDPILHELIARVAFVMEDFNKCIKHNEIAAKLQPDKCYHNNSDIGLAYYRLGQQQGNPKHFETGFLFLRKSLQQN